MEKTYKWFKGRTRDPASTDVEDVPSVQMLPSASHSSDAIDDYTALLLETSSTVLYECNADEQCSIVSMNGAVDEMTGYTQEDFAADSALRFARVHPEDKQTVAESFASIAERGSITCEYRWLTAEGNYRWFSDSAKRAEN